MVYLECFSDFTVRGVPYNSKLVMRRGQRFESARRLLTDSTSFSMRSPSSHRFAYLTLLRRRRDPLQSGGRVGPFRERIKSLVEPYGFPHGG
jgi:hypothetical protein